MALGFILIVCVIAVSVLWGTKYTLMISKDGGNATTPATNFTTAEPENSEATTTNAASAGSEIPESTTTNATSDVPGTSAATTTMTTIDPDGEGFMIAGALMVTLYLGTRYLLDLDRQNNEIPIANFTGLGWVKHDPLE